MGVEGKQRFTELTARFFDDYERAFEALRAELCLQMGDEGEAHLAALWLLSELLFLCFLQCRRWPDGDPHFLTRFWRLYRQSRCGEDTFVSVAYWLLAKASGM